MQGLKAATAHAHAGMCKRTHRIETGRGREFGRKESRERGREAEGERERDRGGKTGRAN